MRFPRLRRRSIPIAFAALWAIASSTSPSAAGPLLDAELVLNVVSGTEVVIRTYPGTVSGHLAANGDFTLDAGSGFAGTIWRTGVGGVVGNKQVTIDTVSFVLGANAAITGNTRDRTGSFGITGGGFAATGRAWGDLFGVSGVTFIHFDLSYGGNRTQMQAPFQITAGGVITLATLTLSSPEADLWHLDTVFADPYSAFTSGTYTLPRVTAMGGVTITPAGNHVVSLVTMSKVRTQVNTITGQFEFLTAHPSTLRLTYAPTAAPAIPEPALLVLVAVGLVGVSASRARRTGAVSRVRNPGSFD